MKLFACKKAAFSFWYRALFLVLQKQTIPLGLTCGVTERTLRSALQILATGKPFEASQVGLRTRKEAFGSGDLLFVVLSFLLWKKIIVKKMKLKEHINILKIADVAKIHQQIIMMRKVLVGFVLHGGFLANFDLIVT